MTESNHRPEEEISEEEPGEGETNQEAEEQRIDKGKKNSKD
ncbi:hypothetical protein [Rothia uropygialis]|nr:hypothetical protein [Kocuria sp. 36]